MSAGIVVEVSLYGEQIMVLDLGWLFSDMFWNSGLLLCVPVWIACYVAAVVVPIRGGGVTVGW